MIPTVLTNSKSPGFQDLSKNASVGPPVTLYFAFSIFGNTQLRSIKACMGE